MPDLNMAQLVTMVVVNFKTEQLIRQAYTTFRKFYPNVYVVMVDNGSQDASTTFVLEHSPVDRVGVVLNARNVGHGPALHIGVMMATTPYVFTWDSDCIMTRPGILEAMVAHFSDPNTYAVGWLRHVNDNGVPYEWHAENPPIETFHLYVHPCASLVDRAKYVELPGYFHHGAIALPNMIAAAKAGYGLVEFPIEDYCTHLQAGTRRMWDGIWNPPDDVPPKAWNPNQRCPI